MNNKSTLQHGAQIAAIPTGALPETHNGVMLNRVGHVTRVLHNSLKGLGLEEIMEHVEHDIPDARDRLSYVARMTEQAAERVLNATDAAIPLQTELATSAVALEQRLKELLANASFKREHGQLAEEALAFLAVTEKNTTETKALLMEIMMAQDFQDLTGQVIKKISDLAQDMEKQLVQVLIDFSPPIVQKETDARVALLNGPQINPHAVGVVASQEQVDELLDSLGF